MTSLNSIYEGIQSENYAFLGGGGSMSNNLTSWNKKFDKKDEEEEEETKSLRLSP